MGFVSLGDSLLCGWQPDPSANPLGARVSRLMVPQEPLLSVQEVQSWGSPDLTGQATPASPDGPHWGNGSRGPRSQPHKAASLHGVCGRLGLCCRQPLSSTSAALPRTCLSVLSQDSPVVSLLVTLLPASPVPPAPFTVSCISPNSTVMPSLPALRLSVAPHPHPPGPAQGLDFRSFSHLVHFHPRARSSSREPGSLTCPCSIFVCTLEGRQRPSSP